MKEKICSSHAPKALGPYSQAVRSGPLLFVSGQLPLDLQTGQLLQAGIEPQTHKVIDHLEAILKEAHLTLSDVVQVTVYLADLQDFSAMNEAYAARFQGPVPPSRATVQVARLPLNSPIEISCIAIQP